MRRANILIVDGDAAVRGVLKRQLDDLGHAVVGEADSGAAGLVLARSLRPDLVLVDMTLPSLSGLDVAKTLLDEQVAPSLLLADGEARDDLDAVESSGVMGFLSKPPRPSDLGPGIQIAIGHWRRIVALETEVRTLNERMEARKLVGRAKAILMERHNLPEREAFRRIQAQSLSLGRPVHEIARAIITASEIPT